MNARFVFILGLLFSSLIAIAANADGVYQRTKDGKVIVWNNHPLPGDAATWSGDRDAKGYANGHGTLTWFTTDQKVVTGSNIPTVKHNASSRYTGDMVRGKFSGMVVNVDPSGKTFHGTFVDGHKGKDWAFGPASATSKAAAVKDESASSPLIAASPKPEESPE